MVSLDIELGSLKENLLEMLKLVKSQLEKSKKALEDHDITLAQEVVEREKRVNALELIIDKDCENILALHTPVASDLRFVLSTIKICGDLESIGDITKGLARYIEKTGKKNALGFEIKFQIPTMIETCISMLSDMGEAIEKADPELAQKIARKDVLLNEINKSAPSVTSELIKAHPEKIEQILKLFTITRKLERVGDFIKNIGSEVVFHIEAKVLKHKKAKI
jgi:phosphate transport system protein